MQRTPTLIAVALAAAALGGLAVISFSVAAQQDHGAADQAEKTVYTCSMHPSIAEGEPGSCPICGMHLVPKATASSAMAESAMAADTVEKTVYTCSMHPIIAEDEPGSCPICGMDLTAKKVSASSKAPPPAVGATAEQTIYTCGMHPTVVEDGPGTCLICGMDLNPKTIGGKAASAAPGPGGKRRIKHWVAPMDPNFVSDKPGKSPMGMDLVPVYEGDGGGSTLTIDPRVVQNMGVRIKRVRRGTIFRHIRTIGTVEVAEDQVSVVNLRYSGWVERIYVDETGIKVKKGRALFDIYSPELVSAQEEYLLALRGSSATSSLAKSARRRLEFFGLSSWHIAKVEKAGKPLRTLHVVAPQSGYVLHKNVVQGARVNAGSDLYRIGNLGKIWVNAEVYEFDAPWVRLGERASMELSFQQGHVYEGTVAYIHPTLNRKSRTLTVRLEFDNPGLALKPGMFATVQIDAQRRNNIITVPTEAVIHSGTRQLVFVAVELGHYEKREIITGMVGDRYMTEVLSGVEPGERVVTSGQFLLDSESQLQEAVQKLLAERLHAKEQRVRKADADGDNDAADPHAGHGHEAESDTYYTCGMHPQIVQDGPGTCPICGMDLTERKK